jgi:hypothetical protein
MRDSVVQNSSLLAPAAFVPSTIAPPSRADVSPPEVAAEETEPAAVVAAGLRRDRARSGYGSADADDVCGDAVAEEEDETVVSSTPGLSPRYHGVSVAAGDAEDDDEDAGNDGSGGA